MNGTRRKKLKINSSIERDKSNLPHDIIQDILSRLPVKSLLRFKCVSKPWYSFISSDSKFARIHLIQSQKNSHSGTLYVHYSRFHFLKFTNLDFELERIEFPVKKYNELSAVLCSCDGLIVLSTLRMSDRLCVIWNPSTRKYIKFPCPYIIDYGNTLYGLCYDASNDDYKFVFLISNSVYVVYSCKNNSWSKEKGFPLGSIQPDIDYFDKRGNNVNGGAGIFVNGVLHWVTIKSRKDSVYTNVKKGCPIYECNYDYTYELCCFDPKDDNFKKMSTPACFDDSSVFHPTNLGGQLCLYLTTYDFMMLDIWMMKDYGDFNSWTKLLTIENMPKPHSNFKFVMPLCLTNKTDVVLYIYNDGQTHLVVYNLEEKMFRERDRSGGDGWRNYMVLSPLLCWNNSLVLPNRIIKK